MDAAFEVEESSEEVEPLLERRLDKAPFNVGE